ncbi:glycosyltransferase family 2 protein (plasmid) [Rhizobium sp. CCGE531]|nr:glycosyltransferase family 2 protein [Rhizobium sp. CCGE531]AYG76655.1 glycosyltransferase family 2 protein [Rhizobium sp. CCGE532]
MFSVVVPTYNRASALAATLNSVLLQTCQDFEVIVVDDGSTDDIHAVVHTLNDARVCVLRQENKGASAARNYGIDHARGKYIAFLDSDDFFLEDHLERMTRILESSDEIIAYSQVICDRGNGRRFVRPPRGIRPEENMATYLICDRGFVQTSGLAMRREIARAIRYNEVARFGDDTDFAIRLQLAGYRFIMDERPSVIWIDHDNSERLSLEHRAIGTLTWLEALRPYIAVRAYHGYRGWHLAKSVWRQSRVRALGLYMRGIFAGAYSPRLAILILSQIIIPDQLYRKMTDVWLAAGAHRGSR